MPQAFSDESLARIDKALTESLDAQAALLPVLYIAQEQFGFLSQDALRLVAEKLNLTFQHVESTATFYTMFKREPVGRYHIQVCRTLSCAMLGAPNLTAHLSATLGIKPGEVTPDGKFSLEEVECLALCGSGPAVQINKTNYERVTPEALDRLLASLN